MFDNPPPTAPDVASKVMVVSLTISGFMGVKVDRRVSQEICDKNQTDARDTGKFNKQFVTKYAVQPIQQIAGQARQAHDTRTVPWNDKGGRLLTVLGYTPYVEEMASLSEKYWANVEKFLEAYRRGLSTNEARTRLKDLFDPDDYPPVDVMRQEFGFEFNMEPFPTSRNWLVDGLNDEMQKLRDDNEARIAAKVEQSVKAVYARVAEVTSKMAESLRAYDRDPVTNKLTGRGFKDSLVGNVRELSSLLPSLNINNDPMLDDIHKKLQDITKFDASQLKVSETMRTQTADKASELFAFVGSLL